MAGNNNNDDLERRAVEELLKEANRGRVRAETMGPAGWMKCPLGSANKRFLLNTLRPCAAENRSGSRSREAEDSREDGRGRRSRYQQHHSEDREHSKRRRECPRSHSQSSRPRDSSLSQLSSTGHATHHSSQSNRTRSRSPIRERPTTKRSPNRTQK